MAARTLPLAVLAALVLTAQPALADETPKIDEIFTTMAEPENAQAVNLLNRWNGTTIYLGTVNADIATDEHYRIAEACFPTKSAEDPAFGGDIKGEVIPIPIEGKPDCSVNFQIAADDGEPYPLKGRGTGIVRIQVQDSFKVRKEERDGRTVFVLTPDE